ncbi:hypothetical protein K469DRAFT_686485 [Zopfia rhizophila CBS 207.26]|uniref:Uncharacterized protein n=1 Tax=Zopfia rhizophila CBS 207.26 TaxID=1314779 RepID=A0A6A6ET17_9PEZI|nr:hypothetical protein K469DRAFT_686485 [Zopfia rhizophila CBS 207.26]
MRMDRKIFFIMSLVGLWKQERSGQGLTPFDGALSVVFQGLGIKPSGHKTGSFARRRFSLANKSYKCDPTPGSGFFCAFPTLPVGALCSAVLARSEKFAAALLRWPNALEEMVSHGFHAIQPAASWPQGVRLLLSHGGSSLISLKDHWRSSTFDHAAIASNAESMVLLLNAGCLALDGSVIWFRLDLSLHAPVVQALKARRQALCALVQAPDLFIIPTD